MIQNPFQCVFLFYKKRNNLYFEYVLLVKA